MGQFSCVVVWRRNVLGRWINPGFSPVVALIMNVPHFLVLCKGLFSEISGVLGHS